LLRFCVGFLLQNEGRAIGGRRSLGFVLVCFSGLGFEALPFQFLSVLVLLKPDMPKTTFSKQFFAFFVAS